MLNILITCANIHTISFNHSFELLTFHPAFLHFLDLQTPAEGGCLKLEQSAEKHTKD